MRQNLQFKNSFQEIIDKETSEKRIKFNDKILEDRQFNSMIEDLKSVSKHSKSIRELINEVSLKKSSGKGKRGFSSSHKKTQSQ